MGNLERLRRFYRHYAPSKVATAELALEAYVGQEEAMFKALERKYGPEADIPTDLSKSTPVPTVALPSPFFYPVVNDDSNTGIKISEENDRNTIALPSVLHFDSLRNRLERIYAFYAPNLLESVDLTLAAYEGRENVLFSLLQQKYGPEPSAFYPISLSGEDKGNIEESAGIRIEMRDLHTLSSYDISAALLEVGFPRDQVPLVLLMYGYGREQYAASTALLVTLIGSALFDPDEKRGIVFPYNQLEQVTGVPPSGIDHLAFEHILVYRRIFLSFLSGLRQLQAQESAVRNVLWRHYQAAVDIVQYKAVILQEALCCLPLVEAELRAKLVNDEVCKRGALQSWFRQQHNHVDLLLKCSSAQPQKSERRKLQHTFYKSRRSLSHGKREETRPVVERWDDSIYQPLTQSSVKQMQQKTPKTLSTRKASFSVLHNSVWKPSGVTNLKARESMENGKSGFCAPRNATHTTTNHRGILQTRYAFKQGSPTTRKNKTNAVNHSIVFNKQAHGVVSQGAFSALIQLS
ncbi:uncharacterized protein TM35_000022380 [Trypanosoma theileri]|uniref:Uncharacterized protein n=1 Tax=Trypanosoma theileri TaxID=67003 RepID=A0A1X0P7K0_9TRYP|nr:uncharacterized protein TM35_000022380 [Trypanosoma theileri]ORC92912.1 hypothetical protein TM35_000022380 [Trypanosoma theileri]